MTPSSAIEIENLSADELRSRLDALAQEALGVSGAEALRQLDAGELRGSIAESKLSMLRFLLGEGGAP